MAVAALDFGVAKAAGQSLTDKTLMTGFGALVGTPEFALLAGMAGTTWGLKQPAEAKRLPKNSVVYGSASGDNGLSSCFNL